MYQNKKLEREVALSAEIVREANEAVTAGQVDIGKKLKRRAEEYSAELEPHERRQYHEANG
jgi:hypothetical protein